MQDFNVKYSLENWVQNTDANSVARMVEDTFVGVGHCSPCLAQETSVPCLIPINLYTKIKKNV